MAESTDFLLLGSATSTTTRPIALSRLAVFYGQNNDLPSGLFLFGYYAKSQDFSEFSMCHCQCVLSLCVTQSVSQ